MKIPYSTLCPHGRVLFVGKGGKIHAFGVDDGAYLSTWKHPDVEKVAEAVAAQRAGNGTPGANTAPAETEDAGDDGPPAKRQRTEEPKDEDMQVDQPEPKPEKRVQKAKPRQAPDQPLITQLVTTSSGSHLVAVSGNDKTIWVHEHDGNGGLKELSRRYAAPHNAMRVPPS